jgi:mono/diheme cytochrome c family protein
LGVIPLPSQVAGIAVYSNFEHPPSPAVIAALHQEIDSIVTPIGLNVVWKSLDSPDRVETTRRLVVTTFQGVCDAGGLPAASFHEGSLGRTHISEGQVLPYMDVDCTRIRGFIRTPLMQIGAAERDAMLGRAMGRVFAHELYHVLGQTKHHGAGIVDRSNYTVRELTSPALRVDENCRILQLTKSTSEATASPSGRTGSRRRGKLKFAEKLCNVCHGPTGQGSKRAPSLRTADRQVDAAMLAIRLGVDGPAMCRQADHMNLTPPSLGKRDIDDLVRYLNAPPF